MSPPGEEGMGRHDQLSYRYTLSSGLFSLPAGAVSVDWAVVNGTGRPQAIRVTVYGAGVGKRQTVAPGPVRMELGVGEVAHNANGVGPGKPFRWGHYYEVVVETNDLGLLPTVQVWADRGNTAIPGSRIGPSDFFLVPASP